MSAGLPDGYVYVSEAARQMNSTDRTVRGMVDRGELDSIRSSAGYRLVSTDSIARFRRHLTVAEAARIMGVSAETVRYRFDTGELRGFRTAAGARRIDPDSLSELEAR